MKRRYGGYNGRRRHSSGRPAILTFLFWAVSCFIIISFIHGGPPKLFEAKGEDVGKMYIGNIFPTVSRGADYESREALGSSLEPASQESTGLLDEKQSKNLFESMMGSMFPAAEVLDDDLAEEDPGVIFDADTGDSDSADTDNPSDETADTEEPIVSKPDTSNIDYTKPVVIIYHTHATESYQPVDIGNFHSLKEYGTVREVGDVMTEELEKLGIQVIHDKTLHDSPSYNQSYTRSLETIKTLLGNTESSAIVIDLHRDAAAYSGNVGKTVNIKKDTVASYNLVVGTGNPNVKALEQFAGEINQKAEEMYPGFGGKIIEKQYKFNQYVSDHHILLEVGNNQNTIEQAKMTGKYFAHVLAEAIKDKE